MELEDYQRMIVEAVNVCKGVRYQNLWWVEEPIRQEDYVIHFWIYWEALHVTTTKFSWLTNEATAKYWRIPQFTIGPHTTHVQAHRDLDRSWLLKCYKVRDEEIEATIDDCPAAWWDLVNAKKVSIGPLVDAPDDLVRETNQ